MKRHTIGSYKTSNMVMPVRETEVLNDSGFKYCIYFQKPLLSTSSQSKCNKFTVQAKVFLFVSRSSEPKRNRSANWAHAQMSLWRHQWQPAGFHEQPAIRDVTWLPAPCYPWRHVVACRYTTLLFVTSVAFIFYIVCFSPLTVGSEKCIYCIGY